MFELGELEGIAKLVLALFGLGALLAAPLLGKLPGLEREALSNPKITLFVCEVAAIATFLLVLDSRMTLHHWPSFLVLVILLVTAAMVLALLLRWRPADPPKPLVVGVRELLGIATYGAVVSLTVLTFTKFAAERMVYRPVHGTVSSPAGEPQEGIALYFVPAGEGEFERSTTNSRGYYRFLLTDQEAEAATEIRLRQNSHTSGRSNWCQINLPEERTPYRMDLVNASTEDLECGT